MGLPNIVAVSPTASPEGPFGARYAAPPLHALWRYTLELRWGLELLTLADERKRGRDRLAQYRDGLMICLLAGRAIRVKSFLLMKIDEHLFLHGERWRLKFEPDDVKNKRWIPR